VVRPPRGKRGRQQIFSDAALQFCLSIKCLFNLALRQSLGTAKSLFRLAGLDWKVPDFSTLCGRQKALRVQLPYRASTTALSLLVDSTGIKSPGWPPARPSKFHPWPPQISPGRTVGL
jgi:hypothetical protein